MFLIQKITSWKNRVKAHIAARPEEVFESGNLQALCGATLSPRKTRPVDNLADYEDVRLCGKCERVSGR